MTNNDLKQITEINQRLANSKSPYIQAFLKTLQADDWTVTAQEKISFELLNLHSVIMIKIFTILYKDSTNDERKAEIENLIDIMFDLGKVAQFIDYLHDKTAQDYINYPPDMPQPQTYLD
ncbi:hypothetical protein HAU32_08470 [Weissella confusa]|uniref:Uncharacterized protein n=1 Tax=Weissella fermenti TaxID=2987699 RepID=A0ABT6D507_9LACO|nr:MULTISPECIES: hypothetical protein [Weissella]MBJ7689005.1 hypothetical protein [Weissella confusa]MCW0928023.1 hypothetical protein [Weissella sp. LMG 11983]MDF9300613.1 hypothetical protein [Weissella sp. BK2]